jgi:hypothetical protein
MARSLKVALTALLLIAAGAAPPLWILYAAAEESGARHKYPLHPERKKTAAERRAERESKRHPQEAADAGP